MIQKRSKKQSYILCTGLNIVWLLKAIIHLLIIQLN
jgi:hypothetical protein